MFAETSIQETCKVPSCVPSGACGSNSPLNAPCQVLEPWPQTRVTTLWKTLLVVAGDPNVRANIMFWLGVAPSQTSSLSATITDGSKLYTELSGPNRVTKRPKWAYL